ASAKKRMGVPKLRGTFERFAEQSAVKPDAEVSRERRFLPNKRNFPPAVVATEVGRRLAECRIRFVQLENVFQRRLQLEGRENVGPSAVQSRVNATGQATWTTVRRHASWQEDRAENDIRRLPRTPYTSRCGGGAFVCGDLILEVVFVDQVEHVEN